MLGAAKQTFAIVDLVRYQRVNLVGFDLACELRLDKVLARKKKPFYSSPLKAVFRLNENLSGATNVNFRKISVRRTI